MLFRSNTGAQKQLYVYGKLGYVPAYYDWYQGSEQTKGTAPTQDANDDRLFAGWYSGDQLATAVTDPTTQNYPFGYFVSKDTQNVFVERTASTNGKFTLRFLFGVPKSLDAIDKLNFTVKLTGGNKTYTLTPQAYLYRRVNVNGTSYVPTAFAQELNTSFGDAEYFVTGYVTGVPDRLANATVTVAPAWTTGDGTAVSRGETTATALPTEALVNQQVQFAR